jgi:hypothetical protein
MEFDINQVYTAVNADELKVGSKVICTDDLGTLKEIIKQIKSEEDDNDNFIEELKDVKDENCDFRFATYRDNYNLAYLISEPEEKKLKWTDLKIGDIIRRKYEDGYRYATVIRIDTYSTEKHIGLGGEWVTDDDIKDWEKVE